MVFDRKKKGSLCLSFSPLKESHFPLLLRWLKRSHIKAWWDPDFTYTLDLVKEKFGCYTHEFIFLSELSKDAYGYIVQENEQKMGYIQAYDVLSHLRKEGLNTAQLPPNSAGIDFFIGEEAFLGKGVGTQMIQEFCDHILLPHFSVCLADPSPENHQGIPVLKKAGFAVRNEFE